MPSGAKKRKAAKKKKEQAAQQIKSTTTTTYHGNDDPRNQDERESDDGTSSPASHDNENRQNPFAEGNGESMNSDPSHRQTLVADEESVKEVSGNADVTRQAGLADDAIKIEKELKPEESVEIRDLSLEHHKSSSSGSSSSSSDDESQEIEKRPEKETKDSAIEVIAHSDMDKPADSLPQQAVSVTGNAPFSGPSANVILETTAVIDSAKPAQPSSEERIHIESIPKETSVVSAVDAAVSNEDDRKSFHSLNENNAKDFPASDENAGASLGAADSDVKENEGKILLASDPVPESNYAPEDAKNSEVPVSSEKETLVQPTHPVVQRTSWLSCCGLFDVITGSSR